MEDLQRSICIFHLKSSYCKLSNLFILSSDQSSLNILLFAAKSVLFLQGFEKWKVCLCFNRGQKMTLCCKDRGNTNIESHHFGPIFNPCSFVFVRRQKSIIYFGAILFIYKEHIHHPHSFSTVETNSNYFS